MSRDPLDDEELSDDEDQPINDEQPGDYVQVLRSSTTWNNMRDDLAESLYNTWLAGRGGAV